MNKQGRFRMSPDPLPPSPKSKGYCLSLQDYSNKPLHTGWLRLGSCKSKAKISNIDLEAPDGECALYLLIYSDLLAIWDARWPLNTSAVSAYGYVIHSVLVSVAEFPLLIKMPVAELRAHLTPVCLHQAHRHPSSPRKSHSEELGIRTSACEFRE